VTDKLQKPDQQPENQPNESRATRCLSAIIDQMSRPDANLKSVCRGIVNTLPQGFRQPRLYCVKLVVEETSYQSPEYKDTKSCVANEVMVQNRSVGRLKVCCVEDVSEGGGQPFLPEESTLVGAVARRLSHFLTFRRSKFAAGVDVMPVEVEAPRKDEWKVVLDLLKQTDRVLLFNIAHKMLNHLCWSGIPEAEAVRRSAELAGGADEYDSERDPNLPQSRRSLEISTDLVGKIFEVAGGHLSDHDILSRIQRWIQDARLSYFVQVANRNLPLSEVANAVRRYHQTGDEGADLQTPSKRGIKVSLISRFFSDQLPFINVAKKYIEIGDFFEILQRTIYSPESYGRLGGKSSGLHLAHKVLEAEAKRVDGFPRVKVPRTWYITSDMMYSFMEYNNFGDIIDQKYKEREEIRYEYPFIVQTFKSAPFPPEMVKGISVALDEFEERPLIVRSSSLLEDNIGAVFSGKYKSLFLANQGSKRERLAALLDAIAEVYASVFASDPIEYRTERGLLDFGEEMGIMIQEVVGTRVGDYYLPVLAGVAFSNNEFRWSPRIRREDGLLRMVLGLGSRAVDRVGDDYPVLVAPGQPDLRVNATAEETLRYAPRYADVLNLAKGSFETVAITDLLRVAGAELPIVEKIVSIYKDDRLQRPSFGQIDFATDDLVVTFEGLITDSSFLKNARTILGTLQEKLGMPVDIEFAFDGTDTYLLQCRAQCHSEESLPSPIPRNIPEERIVFTTNRNVTNGRIPDVAYIVYVDPVQYGEVEQHSDLVEISRVVGALNKTLPRRRFILMGPGRWGSRGDIKLGVSVGYADINNTSMLIEVARKTGHYVPDLSFGTHFFQDLVEAEIRYLPLYPGSQGTQFNEPFLLESPNKLAELLPQYARFSQVVRVIDVPSSAGGQVLRVLMNADTDEAVGVLMPQSNSEGANSL
jgi:pyruvate, water dikinase